MFKSFEQFKSVTKSVYDALRSNPSMKLSTFRQLLCTEAGYLNTQSLNAFYGKGVDPNPEELVGEQLIELFNTSYVIDECGSAMITSSDDSGGNEFQLEQARGVLYDGVLMFYIGVNYEGKYTVYKRHMQPAKPIYEAFIVYVNGASDMGLFLNGESLGYADNSAGDDFEPIVKATLGILGALGCSIKMVNVDINENEWDWDIIPPLLSSENGFKEVGVIDSSEHWFFNHYA